jgi:CHAT domain-containing protein
VLLDAEATIAGFRAEIGRSDIVHLACHGLFRADNPMYSALRLHDGWLTAADVLASRCEGAHVALSACESGRSQVVGGDEALGLTRAFLGAGAATVVVSQWIVQDETAAPLMAAYYNSLKQGVAPVQALRTAQLAIRDAHAHPYYWAPFALVGRR